MRRGGGGCVGGEDKGGEIYGGGKGVRGEDK